MESKLKLSKDKVEVLPNAQQCKKTHWDTAVFNFHKDWHFLCNVLGQFMDKLISIHLYASIGSSDSLKILHVLAFSNQ